LQGLRMGFFHKLSIKQPRWVFNSLRKDTKLYNFNYVIKCFVSFKVCFMKLGIEICIVKLYDE